jgi:hypothetical protein
MNSNQIPGGTVHPGGLPLRSLRIQVSNPPVGGLAGWFVLRSPALQCRGMIAFHRLNDGSNIFDGKAMPGRWASAPQPTPIPVLDRNGQHTLTIYDPDRTGAGSRVDIYPGESEVLDVVVRVENDDECYGWTTEPYFLKPLGRNPNWKLPLECFLSRVVITSSGRKCEGVFRVINDGPPITFRLEPATTEEVARVRQAEEVARVRQAAP